MSRPSLSTPAATPQGPTRWRLRAYGPAPKPPAGQAPVRGPLLQQLDVVALAKDAPSKAREKLLELGLRPRAINFGPGNSLIATVVSVPAVRASSQRSGGAGKKLRVIDKRPAPTPNREPRGE